MNREGVRNSCSNCMVQINPYFNLYCLYFFPVLRTYAQQQISNNYYYNPRLFTSLYVQSAKVKLVLQIQFCILFDTSRSYCIENVTSFQSVSG